MPVGPNLQTILARLTLIAGFAMGWPIDPVYSFRNSGPGTQGAGILQSFSIRDFDSVRRNNHPYPSAMSPGVLHALGGCVDPDGNLPHGPVEYDAWIRTMEDTADPWIAGETRAVQIVLRSSSSAWFQRPPDLDVLLVGGAESRWIDSGQLTEIQDGTSNTFLVGESLPAGRYQFHLYERWTGLCKGSDFYFYVEGSGTQATPTPTGTGGPTLTPTPTLIAGGVTPTPTSTPTPTETLPPYVANPLLRDVGPGTSSAGVPSTKLKVFICPSDPHLYPSSMSPRLLGALGLCRDPDGNRPNAPVEHHVKIQLGNGLNPWEIPLWEPGSEHWIHLVARSSSSRFFDTPPEFHLEAVGSSGNGYQIISAGLDRQSSCTTYQVNEDPILWKVPEDLPGGLYRIHGYDTVVGLCIASEQAFLVPAGPGSGATATPTPTGPTPTPTRTFRRPDYNNDLFVNGSDLPGFLERLIIRSEESDLNGEDDQKFKDLFMFSLWWQRDRLGKQDSFFRWENQ